MQPSQWKLFAAISLLGFTVLACSVLDGLAGAGDAEPTEAATDASDTTYTEEFNTSLPDWVDYITGEGDQAHTSIVDGGFLYDIESANTYAYTFYEGETYADVRVQADVENIGEDDNYMTLVCRENEDGWYEFNIASDGFYSIIIVDVDSFNALDEGSTEAVNLGKASNSFAAVCQGNQLSLYINGELVASVSDDTYSEGFVGIGAASFGDLPVRVIFERFSASQP